MSDRTLIVVAIAGLALVALLQVALAMVHAPEHVADLVRLVEVLAALLAPLPLSKTSTAADGTVTPPA